MRRVTGVGQTLALGAVLGLSAGCGGGVSSPTGSTAPEDIFHESIMGQVGLILRTRQDDAKKPPVTAADLAKFERTYTTGGAAIRKGDVVIVWGAPVQEGASDKVLAYEKQVGEAGGFVLMQDARTVKRMTADQFKAAPQASKS